MMLLDELIMVTRYEDNKVLVGVKTDEALFINFQNSSQA